MYDSALILKRSLPVQLWITCFLLCLTAAAHSVAASEDKNRWQLNVDEWLPEKVPFKSIEIEASVMDAYIIMEDGSYHEWTSATTFPESWQIREIALSGPESNLILVTRSGEELKFPLNTVALRLTQHYVDGRREVGLDFNCFPEGDEEEDFEVTSIVANIAKTVIFGGMDSIHLKLQASSDLLSPTTEPSLAVLFEMGDGSLELNISSLDGVQKAEWRLAGEFGDHSVFMKRIVKAVRLIGKSATLMQVDSEYKRMLKNVLSYSETIADYTDIALKTISGTAEIAGDSEFMLAESGDFGGHFNNQLEIKSTHENWSALVGTETSLSGGPESPYQWRQALVVSNPAQNLLNFARWVRLNALQDLANFLNTPSIVYFGYLGEKFSQVLVTMFESLGNKQEDGSLAFSIARDGEGSFWVGETCVNQIGPNLYQKLKEKARFW